MRDMKKKRVEPAKYFAPVSEISVGCRRDCIQLIVAFVSILSRMQECRGIEPRDNVRNSQAANANTFDRSMSTSFCFRNIRVFEYSKYFENVVMPFDYVPIYICAYLLIGQIIIMLIALARRTFNMLALSISATWCLLCCTPQILSLILS